MNKKLTLEIVKHIYNLLGLYKDNNLTNMMIVNLSSNDFLINKKIITEDEDGNKIENNIYGIESKTNDSVIKILLADLSEEEDESEYTVIIKLDSFPAQIIKFSFSSSRNIDDYDIYLNPLESKWIRSDITNQAKLLMGFEYLSSLFLNWKKINDYDDLYKLLIGFLNFDQS